jgi:hypothetical protein
MNYFLMHKEVAVAELDYDESINFVLKVGEVSCQEHVPLGITVKNGQIDRTALNNWWKERSIPDTRLGLREALMILGVSSPQQLLGKSHGLSLSDQYWIKPKDKKLTWAEVNFFDNHFSEDVGDVLFGRSPKSKKLNLISPDSTSNGWLKKKWAIADGKPWLLKGGSQPFKQEPFNEVIASSIMRRLGVPHVPYTLNLVGSEPLSVCQDFITKDTELVSAWHIRLSGEKSGSMSEYQHFLNCCETLGIPGVKKSVDRMLTVDFLIANEDRHFYNFGAIRNAETLKWLCPAPIFDSGTSLWCNIVEDYISASSKQESKPFRNKHSEQIKLVTDFTWVNLRSLAGIDEEFNELLQQNNNISDKRRSALSYALKDRVTFLETIISLARPAQGSGLNFEIKVKNKGLNF